MNNSLNNTTEVLDDFAEKAQQIEVLIERIADINHYRFFNDVDFIIDAIGEKNYPGSPAIDVLPSHDDIEYDRRETVKDYVYCLSTWIEGKEIEDALGEFKANEKVLRNVYKLLDLPDEDKKQLVSDLIEALNNKIASPDDVVSKVTDEEFIFHVYKTILGREPDEDEAKIKLTVLKRGQTRQELVKDVIESRETSKKILADIAASIEIAKPVE